MGTALLSLTLPSPGPLAQRSHIRTATTELHCLKFSVQFSHKPLIFFCSSSSSSSSQVSVVEEEGQSPPESAIEDADKLPFRGCEGCGRVEIEKGCNGEGRIQGGIATFPGFGWWPIKAYRPCPGFIAAGGRYKRQGQSMDEVAFGRGGPPRRETTSQTTNIEDLSQ